MGLTHDPKKDVANKKLQQRLKREARDRQMAATRAADAELLLPETAGYLELDDPTRKTRDVTQLELRRNVDLRTAHNSFSLALDNFGPYRCGYTRNGKHMLLAGEKGHVALMDWKRKKLVCETHVKDTVHDACFLHNETWFALAQSRNVHIYDKNAVELHILREHAKCTLLDYLPYHWLLVSAGAPGLIQWHDVSVGALVAQYNGHSGPARSLRQNGANGVMCVGHAKGVVNMWTPSMNEPVVKMLCHRGPVVSIAVNRAGTVMATAGLDSMVHVWDLRTHGKLHSVRTRRVAGQLDISQRGMLAVGDGTFVDVYGAGILSAPQPEPYMSVHTGDRREVVHSVRFCPYEDVLGVGRAGGFTSAVIPGCGEPNIDSFEANPFITRTQRREADVQALLDKAPPETIMLNPHELGAVDPMAAPVREVAEKAKFVPKHKSGGKDKSGLREKRKRLVSDAEFLKQRREEVLAEREEQQEQPVEPKRSKSKKNGSGDVLTRFK